MEAKKTKDRKPKKRSRNQLRQYRYNGRKPFTFIYKGERIMLERGDLIPMFQVKLTQKLRRMLTEVEEDE